MKIFDENFNLNEIKSGSFKEDSVREEVITPILRKLGYSAFDKNKIIRSKKLKHPYIQFRIKRESIHIIPDYLIQVDGKNAFIIDAKSPSEDILSGRNSEQAFSYAIHREVRVDKYALCNGLEFVIFDVNQIKPILHLKVDDVESRWSEIYRILSPLSFTKPYIFDYKPDFGVWWLKSGMDPKMIFHFVACEVGPIGRVDEETFTFTASIPFERVR